MKPSIMLAPEKYSVRSTTGPFASLKAMASKGRRRALNNVSNQAKDPKVEQQEPKYSLTVDDLKLSATPSAKQPRTGARDVAKLRAAKSTNTEINMPAASSKVHGKRKAEETEQPRPKSKVAKLVHDALSPASPSSLPTKRKLENRDTEGSGTKRSRVFLGVDTSMHKDQYLMPPTTRRRKGLPPRALFNHKFTDTINSTIQALHGVRELATLDSAKYLTNLQQGGMDPERLQIAKKGTDRAVVADMLEAIFRRDFLIKKELVSRRMVNFDVRTSRLTVVGPSNRTGRTS